MSRQCSTTLAFRKPNPTKIEGCVLDGSTVVERRRVSTRQEEGYRAILERNSNTQCLNGQPLRRDLEGRLGRPLTLANDADCFALAEARLGAGRGHSVVFGVILGTGVGGGIVLDGRLHRGRLGIAGEWGHHLLHPGGRSCYCGRRGCVETYLSGPALERRYRELGGEALPLPEIAENGVDSERGALVAWAMLAAR